MVTSAKVLHGYALVTVVSVGALFSRVLAKVEEETKNLPSLIYVP